MHVHLQDSGWAERAGGLRMRAIYDLRESSHMIQKTVSGLNGPSWDRSTMRKAGNGPISRRHLHDELLARLRDCIVQGELEPGAKIPEKDLCERFGVSRTPLREALKVLAFEGLVVLNHNRGSTVSPLTLQDLKDAFPIYARLEGLAGELACERLSSEEIADIRGLQVQMVDRFHQEDFAGHRALNEQIHERIEAGSRNQNLIQLIRCVSGRVRRAWVFIDLPGPCLASAIAEHEAILVAIERRDAPLLSRLLRDHVENSFDATKEAFAAKHGLRLSGERDGNPELA